MKIDCEAICDNLKHTLPVIIGLLALVCLVSGGIWAGLIYAPWKVLLTFGVFFFCVFVCWISSQH